MIGYRLCVNQFREFKRIHSGHMMADQDTAHLARIPPKRITRRYYFLRVFSASMAYPHRTFLALVIDYELLDEMGI